MREMLLDKDLRLRLGLEAKRTALKFPWESTVQRMDAVYIDLLKNGKANSSDDLN